MLPPRSYRPPVATRGPRLATRGRKIPRSSLGFRGALWGGCRRVPCVKARLRPVAGRAVERCVCVGV
eukprot:scaffold17942_cov109-Isochrysis_galbana.AAC.3